MILKFFVSLALLAGTISANPVTIVNWNGNNCRGASRKCTNIPRQTCCSAVNRYISSSRFDGLYETELGIIYKPSGSSNCGTSYKSNNGRMICIDGSFLSIKGADWISCLDCKRDAGNSWVESMKEAYNNGTEGTCTSTVEPDKGVLSDGHMFEIGPTIPQADRDTINDYIDADASISDIPEYLLVHEVDPEGVARRALEAAGLSPGD